jgi:hypothetical protein
MRAQHRQCALVRAGGQVPSLHPPRGEDPEPYPTSRRVNVGATISEDSISARKPLASRFVGKLFDF